MARPTKPESERKTKVTITLSKSMYKNLKKKSVNISGTIEKLLRVAYFTDSELLRNNLSPKGNSPAQIRTAVHASKGHDDTVAF